MTQVPNNIKARVKAKLEESIALAEAHFNTTFRMPTIKYAKRGTTAGTANYRSYTVDFNAIILMENIEDFLARTVPHEMAHLIDHKMNPGNFRSSLQRTTSGWKRTKRTVHGASWKNIMGVLGASTDRCHSYDTSSSRIKKAPRTKFTYICKTCNAEMKLGAVRHRKMLSGRAKYWMRGCQYHAGYTFVVAGLPATLPVADQAPAAPTAPRAPKVNKLTKCRALYDWTASRHDNINLFIAGAGCTAAGAATYYAKIKNEQA